jgi:hypothetical protein
MLESLGIALVAIVTFCVTFVATFLYLDRNRYWADAGLAAIIPMGVTSLATSTVATAFVVWMVA